jgi:two-component system, sensor histidine kinase YesM
MLVFPLKNFIIKLISRLNIYSRKSIQTKLLSTYIIINIVPLVLVGIISYIVSSNAISDEVKRNNTQLIDEISRNINLYIQDLTQLSNTYVSKVLYKSINSMESLNRKSLDLNDIDVVGNLMQMNEYINTTYSSRNDFLSIRLFSDKGDFLSTAFDMQNYKLYRYNSPEEIEWLKKMYENKTNTLIFDVHPIEKNGELSFVASKPAINPYSNIRYGYICYDKEISSFASLFKQFERREGSEVQVIKPDGTLLYHTNQALIGKIAEKVFLNLIGDSNEDNIVTEINYKKMIITYNKLTYGNLTVIGSIPVNELTKQINPLRNITVIICIVSLLLVIALSMILSFFIAKPIKKLNSLMTQVENGNLNVAVDTINGDDEIGHLGRSFNSMVNTINQLVKSEYEGELHRKDAELKALLMQINPHFLYNTLEVVSAIADCEGIEKISDITQSLSKILRYNIDLKSEKVKIRDEVNNCKDYFLILQSRFENNLEIETEFDVETENYIVVKMILQPLIENSIKHGIEKKIGKGQIMLSVKKLDEWIKIEIKDNGIGFSEEKLEEFKKYMEDMTTKFYDSTATKSLGLKNVYARLRIFFGDKLGFNIESHIGLGTTISISFPAIENTEGVNHGE